MPMRAGAPIAARPYLTEGERAGEITESFGDVVRRNAREIAWGEKKR
jgi:hypothetical protein